MHEYGLGMLSSTVELHPHAAQSVLHNLATASPCRLNQPRLWSQWWGTLSMRGALIQKTHKPTEATNTLFETSWFQN
jgi:hypothetical protein